MSNDLPSRRAATKTRSKAVERRILLAEDDRALRTLLAIGLAKDGYQVDEAVDGTHALELLAADATASPGRSRYDLIVCDVRMPGWSGLDLLASARNFAGSLPVVLITAFGDEQLHADARKLGAVATLDKPFDVDDLRTIVQSTLAGTW